MTTPEEDRIAVDHTTLQGKIDILKINYNTFNAELIDEISEVAVQKVVKLICAKWNCAESDFIQTSFEVLFMALENKTERYVSDLLHTLLSDHQKTVLEDSKEIPGATEGIKIPKDDNELCDYIQKAANSKQKIKAVCTKYSKLWTDIGDTEGMIIDTSGLKRKLPLKFLTTEEEKQKKKYYHFEAGVTMEDIQEELWPNAKRSEIGNHRVFASVTNGAGLSLAGTVSTGAHGNGLRNKIVADAVVSFQMFTVDSNWKVKRYQIEPSNGITDRVKFDEQRNIQGDAEVFKLIQDTETFNASVVNIGCLGVVYSYVLSTVPAFYLEEERKVYTWTDAKPIIAKLYEDDNVYNFQVIGSPYAYKLHPAGKDEHRVLISILRKTENIVGKGERSKGHMHLPMGLLDKALIAIGNSNPHMIPVLMHFPLTFLEHEKVALNAVEALNTLSGVVAKEFSGVITSECAMRSDGPETIFAIMNDLHKLYNDIRISNNRQLVNVPIALRFTAPSNKFMAMEFDKERPTITIEQSIINGTLRADDTLRKFRKRMFENFQGRPHWGLLHEMDDEKLKRLYGKNGRKKFISVLNKFDPNCVFENDFAEKVFGKERKKKLCCCFN